ncbi:hypothetical protein PR202_gb10349 [Eleusine coracana subsp. coracana]|uniref:Uncharacterized protein n=1 Tax=Eleusine coracana subsp. coracana TaxID=191504 RepID=A0AAV5EHD2_ELECO|nr:hypothetical protein PR202_gb10349 [Eleusine coracana subsp. coracana]
MTAALRILVSPALPRRHAPASSSVGIHALVLFRDDQPGVHPPRLRRETDGAVVPSRILGRLRNTFALVNPTTPAATWRPSCSILYIAADLLKRGKPLRREILNQDFIRSAPALRDTKGDRWFSANDAAAGCVDGRWWTRDKVLSRRNRRVVEGTTPSSGGWRQTRRMKEAWRISRRKSLQVAAFVRAAISTRRHTGSAGVSGASSSGVAEPRHGAHVRRRLRGCGISACFNLLNVSAHFDRSDPGSRDMCVYVHDQ